MAGGALKLYPSLIYLPIHTKSVLSIYKLNQVRGIEIIKINSNFWYPEARERASYVGKLIKQNTVSACISKDNLGHNKCPPNHSGL